MIAASLPHSVKDWTFVLWMDTLADFGTLIDAW